MTELISDFLTRFVSNGQRDEALDALRAFDSRLTIRTRDLEDLSTEATALLYTLRAYPGQCPADARLGDRQIATAKRLVELCDKIAKYNDREFKRTSIDELMEATS